jgi:hypothetical protein
MDTTEAEDERMTMQPHVKPKIKEIAELIRRDGLIHRGEEKGQKANADLAKHYTKITNDYHGHKGAVKAIRGLVKGTIDDAYDFMRTFVGLAEHFDLFPGEDLAGPGITPPKMPVPKGDDDFEASAEELAAQRDRPKPIDGVTDEMIANQQAHAAAKSNVSPIESASKHLKSGTKPTLTPKYEGDNADLAGEAVAR